MMAISQRLQTSSQDDLRLVSAWIIISLRLDRIGIPKVGSCKIPTAHRTGRTHKSAVGRRCNRSRNRTFSARVRVIISELTAGGPQRESPTLMERCDILFPELRTLFWAR